MNLTWTRPQWVIMSNDLNLTRDKLVWSILKMHAVIYQLNLTWICISNELQNVSQILQAVSLSKKGIVGSYLIMDPSSMN